MKIICLQPEMEGGAGGDKKGKDSDDESGGPGRNNITGAEGGGAAGSVWVCKWDNKSSVEAQRPGKAGSAALYVL